MQRQYVAYQGDEFTIEWYFDDRGCSYALEYFDALTIERKKKLIHLFKLMGDMGKIHNEEKFRYEGDQVYAFKPSQDRFLCFFFDGAKIIVVSAYEKKMPKMPVREKSRALKAKKDYEEKAQKGKYYE
jgi:hypothetical protein